jgi:hypothetical protein
MRGRGREENKGKETKRRLTFSGYTWHYIPIDITLHRKGKSENACTA